MTFAPIRKEKLAEQVARRIREAIVAGSYKPGDPLPSERDLAGQFGVNRSSVREALLRLEAWGLVDIRQGGATRIRDFFRSAGIQLLPFLLAPSGDLDRELLADVLSIRVMLLSWTAGEVAAKAPSQAACADLSALIEAMGTADVRDLQRLDMDFFVELVALTGNKVLGLFANAFREVYEENGQHFSFLYRVPFDLSLHRKTLVCLLGGDSGGASEAMREFASRALASGIPVAGEALQ